MAKWTKVGAVLLGKDGKSTYIKIGFNRPQDGEKPMKEVVLKEGQIVRVQDPRKSLYMTPERLAKIPDFVKFELFLAPENKETEEAAG